MHLITELINHIVAGAFDDTSTQNWHDDSLGYTKQIYLMDHLKVKDGGPFFKIAPSGARDNDIFYIQPILVILQKAFEDNLHDYTYQ